LINRAAENTQKKQLAAEPTKNRKSSGGTWNSSIRGKRGYAFCSKKRGGDLRRKCEGGQVSGRTKVPKRQGKKMNRIRGCGSRWDSDRPPGEPSEGPEFGEK